MRLPRSAPPTAEDPPPTPTDPPAAPDERLCSFCGPNFPEELKPGKVCKFEYLHHVCLVAEEYPKAELDNLCLPGLRAVPLALAGAPAGQA